MNTNEVSTINYAKRGVSLTVDSAAILDALAAPHGRSKLLSGLVPSRQMAALAGRLGIEGDAVPGWLRGLMAEGLSLRLSRLPAAPVAQIAGVVGVDALAALALSYLRAARGEGCIFQFPDGAGVVVSGDLPAAVQGDDAGELFGAEPAVVQFAKAAAVLAGGAVNGI